MPSTSDDGGSDHPPPRVPTPYGRGRAAVAWKAHLLRTGPGPTPVGSSRWVDDTMEMRPEYWLNDLPYARIEYEGPTFAVVLHNPRRLIILVSRSDGRGARAHDGSSAAAGGSGRHGPSMRPAECGIMMSDVDK